MSRFGKRGKTEKQGGPDRLRPRGRQKYNDLLRPEVVNTVAGLSLIARIAVEGYTSGLNRSLSIGHGLEFSQYRGYEPGDDLRLLDWKMLARSGRYYIKQSEIESLVGVKFIVDASASMLHREDGLSKLEYARLLVAALAYLAWKQGDAVGLFALNESDVVSLFSGTDKKHYNRLLLELLKVDGSGKWPDPSRASRMIPDRGSRELVFFLTDMYEREAELSGFLREIKSPRNEVVVLHIAGRSELEFDYGKQVTFEDLETGAKVKVDARKARSAYLEQMEERLDAIRQQLLSQGIFYHLFRMDEPLGEALQYYLKQRNRMN
ncbi:MULTISPECIES: DUF58 domain-containing protein [unclassified Robiginitalea]|uniref:DUF58 domain-containing protein n=1 Tax=Robiginitalea TaxID=252306 RepID=UPI00234ACBF3|nr:MULTISPECIES: DUF58 domain-containing protein [unclassified Robiginitalea]MDC6355693.1 DUF58 domain-containing protein [Robiginitalea sp. PM2]MDC6376104.1 DUF58 domain-containing protein [Robiginitalea sp. SP8]